MNHSGYFCVQFFHSCKKISGDTLREKIKFIASISEKKLDLFDTKKINWKAWWCKTVFYLGK